VVCQVVVSEGFAGDRVILIRLEAGIVGGNFDRGEVRVDRDFAGSGIERDDCGLGEDFPGGG
jgi:hypothetical protein